MSGLIKHKRMKRISAIYKAFRKRNTHWIIGVSNL